MGRNVVIAKANRRFASFACHCEAHEQNECNEAIQRFHRNSYSAMSINYGFWQTDLVYGQRNRNV